MVVQKTCKMAVASLCVGVCFLVNFSNAQSACGPRGCPPRQIGILNSGGYGSQFGVINVNPNSYGRGPVQCDPRNHRSATSRPAPPATRPVAQPQRQPAAGTFPKCVVDTRSHFDGTTKKGRATAIKFEGKFYLVSCAHVWGSGFKHSIIFEGQEHEVKILAASNIEDLAILSCPKGLYYIDLILAPPTIGETVGLGRRVGRFRGYKAHEIVVRGYVADGESGGPIFTKQGLVGVIASYVFETGTSPLGGDTSGPHAARIANLIRGISVSPPPHVPEPNIDLFDDVFARISKLEDQIASLPQDGNCRELVLQVHSLSGTVEANKKEIDLNRRNILDLDKRLKEVTLNAQRTAEAVEILQKEVIAQNERVGVLDNKGRDSLVRIQRLEQSTTASTTHIQQTPQRGRMQFRMRLDQSGRVIGVEPR